MKVMMKIPIEAYLICTTRLPTTSRECSVMTNGVIDREADGQETLEFICDSERAKELLKTFARVCPEFLHSIEHRLDFQRST
jgi:hypothetical protein